MALSSENKSEVEMPGKDQAEDGYQALVLEEKNGLGIEPALRRLPESAFPNVGATEPAEVNGQVVVAVSHSSMNYKDALAVTNRGKIIRAPYPVVPGIDLAGTVIRSDSAQWQPGDKVLATGWELGERYWGGFSQLAKVRAGWLVALPDGLTLEQSMAIGTAGFTAMLAVEALEQKGLSPKTAGGSPVVVTGASGGVGSFAVAILSRLGYTVAASTGRDDDETRRYLAELGAAEITGRMSPSGKPLDSERWAGAVDAVGGQTLAALLTTMRRGASVAVCGLAGGTALPATVFPFILRGVSLLGIDSVMYPRERRPGIWARIAASVPAGLLEKMTRHITLADVPAAGSNMLDNGVRGRVVVHTGG